MICLHPRLPNSINIYIDTTERLCPFACILFLFTTALPASRVNYRSHAPIYIGCVTGIYYQLGFVQEYLYTQLPNFPRKTWMNNSYRWLAIVQRLDTAWVPIAKSLELTVNAQPPDACLRKFLFFFSPSLHIHVLYIICTNIRVYIHTYMYTNIIMNIYIYMYTYDICSYRHIHI